MLAADANYPYSIARYTRRMPNNIKALRKARGLTQQQLADAIGIHVTNLNRLENSKSAIDSRRVVQIANQLGVPPSDIFSDSHPQTVPIVGYVGAGAETHMFSEAQGPFDQVAAPEGSTDRTVAAEVRGESLGSFFDRWLVFYDDVRRPVTTDLFNQICVVGLEDGRVLIKKLKPARQRGFYHLLSQTEEPILDVPVSWAARVKTMTPR